MKPTGFMVEVSKYDWCKKSDKVKQKTIWFKYKKEKYYVALRICDRCNTVVGMFWYN